MHTLVQSIIKLLEIMSCYVGLIRVKGVEKHVHIIFGTSSCFEFWWFELLVINVVFKFRPVELMVGL